MTLRLYFFRKLHYNVTVSFAPLDIKDTNYQGISNSNPTVIKRQPYCGEFVE